MNKVTQLRYFPRRVVQAAPWESATQFAFVVVDDVASPSREGGRERADRQPQPLRMQEVAQPTPPHVGEDRERPERRPQVFAAAPGVRDTSDSSHAQAGRSPRRPPLLS